MSADSSDLSLDHAEAMAEERAAATARAPRHPATEKAWKWLDHEGLALGYAQREWIAIRLREVDAVFLNLDADRGYLYDPIESNV